MFRWRPFLVKNHIDFVEIGPNVARGNVNVRCPMCSEDPSHHMGINLTRPGWGCWRNRAHRGRSPVKLIQALLRCTWEQAREIAGVETAPPMDDNRMLFKTVSALMNAAPTVLPIKSIQFTEEIKPLRDGGLGKYFCDYLCTRHYRRDEIPSIVHTYGLRYAVTGPFRYRLVLPIIMPQGLVNWTGRTVDRKQRLRYRTLSSDPMKAKEEGLPVAALSVEKTLWNAASLLMSDGEKLVVTEGPLDAMRVDWLGRRKGIRATCLFGTGNLTMEQIALLEQLAPRFKRRLLLLDSDAWTSAIHMWDQLHRLEYERVTLPLGYEDPAELDASGLASVLGKTLAFRKLKGVRLCTP